MRHSAILLRIPARNLSFEIAMKQTTAQGKKQTGGKPQAPATTAAASKAPKENAPKPGELNIVGLFEAEAAALLQAAERGRILHKTRNIRDSGTLLESTFRQIIGSRLPPQAQMAHGYLYDLESTCTPQVDAMILSAADNYPMMSAEGGAIYAPFTSCRAYVEIKSSVGDALKCLRQTAKISNRIAEMGKPFSDFGGTPSRPEQVGSILLFANSEGAKAAPFIDWFEKGHRYPALVVFLDKAVVISRRPVYKSLLTWFPEEGGDIKETLDLGDPFNGDEAWLYRPSAQDPTEAKGMALLWLYYYLLFCATSHEVERARDDKKQREQVDSVLTASDTLLSHGSHNGKIPPVAAFVAAANRRFPLVAWQKLATVTEFTSSF